MLSTFYQRYQFTLQKSRTALSLIPSRADIRVPLAVSYTHLDVYKRQCLVTVAPVAAHKRVRLVPVADVLVCTDGDDIADLFAVENGL